MNLKSLWIVGVIALIITACNSSEDTNMAEGGNGEKDKPSIKDRLDQYATVKLDVDLSDLSSSEKKMIPLFIKASRIMDDLFWRQSLGSKNALLKNVKGARERYVEINYGPWDILDDNKPFIAEYDAKPLGANFYPRDMTKEEFENADLADKASLYTLLRRDDQGELVVKWYHDFFKEKLTLASRYLTKAEDLAEDPGLKKYLDLRASALLTDDYYASDMAWMDMKNNRVDIVIGPIETYEDQLFGYKAAYEAYVLKKDREWSDRLEKYTALLPDMQAALPVGEKYKQEIPGTDSDLGAYDVLFYAGHANAGPKTIAINLPNDERVQLEKGTRRLQLKNAMQAKFDKILVPLKDVVIDPDQRQHVTFDAFFSNTMFHEVAHGLGIKHTINDGGTVREALKEQASAIEEGKADILGLFLIHQLHERGELGEGDLMDYYVTFLAGIFRSIRFGATSAHGNANMIRFNYFKEKGAFTRNAAGHYSINKTRFEDAVESLSREILILQGNGDYEGTLAFVEKYGKVDQTLADDLKRINKADIPVDIIFKQGVSVIKGLKLEKTPKDTL